MFVGLFGVGGFMVLFCLRFAGFGVLILNLGFVIEGWCWLRGVCAQFY